MDIDSWLFCGIVVNDQMCQYMNNIRQHHFEKEGLNDWHMFSFKKNICYVEGGT